MKISNALSSKGIKKIPGLVSLHKFIYKIVNPKGIIIIPVKGFKMYVNTQDKVIAKSLITNGSWEEFETDLIFNILKQGDVVVDIGANIGYYTIIAAGIVGKEGKIFAFEPEPGNFELLSKNVTLNGFSNIHLQNKAISDKNGNVRLYLDKANLGAPSFSEKNIFIEKGNFIDVKTLTLDGYLEDSKFDQKLDFIKIDAEGAEGLIIKGAQKSLQDNNAIILMEFWPYGQKNIGTDPQKLLNTLSDLKYKIKIIDDKNQSVRSIDVEEIFKICQSSENGKGHVNLLFEK
jgi:FkbM family methyltransferase